MAKYYYEAGGEVHEADMTVKEASSFRKSNPHLDLKSASQTPQEQRDSARTALASRIARDKRAAEYPPIGDQLDALMKWLATETEFTVPAELKSMAMTCMSVKSKYPVN